MACQGKIVQMVGTTVLPSNNVLDVMHELGMMLLEPAILTPPARPFSDEPSGSGVHILWNGALLRDLAQMAAGFEFENRDKVGCVNQRLVLGAFLVVETTFIRPFTEFLDPSLNRGVNAKGNKPPGGLGVKAVAQRFQKAVKPGASVHANTLTHDSGDAELRIRREQQDSGQMASRLLHSSFYKESTM